MNDDRGSAALLTVLMLPVLLLAFAGAVEIGLLRVTAARVRGAADLAALVAVNDQDEDALARDGHLVLARDADRIARETFAWGLEPIGALLAEPAEAIASRARIAVDPTDATVRLSGDVPVATPGLAALGLAPVVVVSVRSVAGAR